MPVARAFLEQHIHAELPAIPGDGDEARRSARLVARITLNQGNGTFSETNLIADDLADMIVTTLRREGLLKEEEKQ